MSSLEIQKVRDDAIEWALTHGVAFKESLYSAVHTPFTLTPTPISRGDYQHLKGVAQTLSKLIYAVSEDHGFLYDAIHPIAAGDPFFSALLSMHQHIHSSPGPCSSCAAILWTIGAMATSWSSSMALPLAWDHLASGSMSCTAIYDGNGLPSLSRSRIRQWLSLSAITPLKGCQQALPRPRSRLSASLATPARPGF